VLDDGIDTNDRPFRNTFPYMALAQSGQEHIHDNPVGGTVPPPPTPDPCDPSDDNVVQNGGFEAGTAPWQFYTNGSGNFSVATPAFECTQAARIQISEGGSNVQLYQQGLSLEPNTAYRLHFAAYSSTGRDLALFLHKHGAPYTNYGLSVFQVNLSSSWQSYEVEFTTSGFTSAVNDGRLRFWLAPFAQPGDLYWIDDVRLEKVQDVAAAAANGRALRPTRLASGNLVIGLTQNDFDPAIADTVADGNALEESQLMRSFLPAVTK
jgi:hypothetical protein